MAAPDHPIHHSNILNNMFADHAGETAANTELDHAERRAHAKAARLLAASSCPPDLIQWGRMHGIPTFAEVTWMDGFAVGMRKAMLDTSDPEPSMTEQIIAEMEALQRQLSGVRVALGLTGMEGRPVSSYVRDLKKKLAWHGIESAPRDGTQILMRAMPRGYERWTYGVGSLTSDTKDRGWSHSFPPTEWQHLD